MYISMSESDSYDCESGLRGRIAHTFDMPFSLNRQDRVGPYVVNISQYKLHKEVPIGFDKRSFSL